MNGPTVPDRPQAQWPDTTEWVRVTLGRRWGSRGGYVIRRGFEQWPVKIYPLDEHRRAPARPSRVLPMMC
jgi:hypothetical protein